jgi:hypothetical protein
MLLFYLSISAFAELTFNVKQELVCQYKANSTVTKGQQGKFGKFLSLQQ